MASRRLARIGQGLIAAGRNPSTPAVIVERASTPKEKIVSATLESLAVGEFSGTIEPPCVLVVGHVAAAARGYAE